jgi:RpiR family transcriptional regulator, carbohydrate utilization regulator
MLARVHALADTFTKTERRIAQKLLADPQAFARESIATLSAHLETSEPSLVRFARTLGAKGYTDFRLQLVKSLAVGVPYIHEAVRRDDPAPVLTQHIFNCALDALAQLRESLDSAAIDAAIQALSTANKIEFYGFGTSGIVAAEAQHKFFRLDVPTVAYSDPHMQSMSAAILRPGDAVVAISHSGRSSDLLRSVRIAAEAGATIIALTTTHSPLSKLASIAIHADVPENADTLMPMTSRLGHLVIVDLLAVGVALRRGPRAESNLKKVKAAAAANKTPRRVK